MDNNIITQKTSLFKIIMYIFCSVLLLLITGCSTHNDYYPSEKTLMTLVPPEITNYYLEDVNYTADVVRVEMEKGIKTDIGYDAYCKIILEDQNLCRTVYYILHCAKSYENSWYVSDYESYGEEVITCIKKGPSIKAIQSVEGLSEVTQFKDLSTYTDNSFVYETNISQEYTYFSCEGSMTIQGYIVKQYDSTYDWAIYSDDTNMNYNMDYLIGAWELTESTNMYMDDCILTISSVDTVEHTITWTLDSNSDDELRGTGTCYYSFDGENLSFEFDINRKEGKKPYTFNISYSANDSIVNEWKKAGVWMFDSWASDYDYWGYKTFEKIN